MSYIIYAININNIINIKIYIIDIKLINIFYFLFNFTHCCAYLKIY